MVGLFGDLRGRIASAIRNDATRRRRTMQQWRRRRRPTRPRPSQGQSTRDGSKPAASAVLGQQGGVRLQVVDWLTSIGLGQYSAAIEQERGRHDYFRFYRDALSVSLDRGD